ncbi:MAG TPA: radical SAM protein [Polyangia bacterium]|nr:radical SAM protein [Polyangia bacterium]
MRALVVFPSVSVARDFIDYPYFADLGAVQLAAVLEARGVEVALVDAFALAGSSLTWRSDGRALLGASVDEILAAVRGERADLIVVAYTPFHRPPARDDVLGALLAGLRSSAGATPIVLADLYQSGQHYVESDGVLASYPEADAWVKYEGEVTIPALVDGLARGERPSGVYRGVEVASLDELPAPAWERVDLAAYARFHERVRTRLGRGHWAFPIDGRTLPMVTSRGCPFTCVHCSSNPGRADGAPKLQRRLSADVLRERLRALKQRHGATRIEVLDELVNVNERHFDAFLDEAAALDVAFDVPNGMRADYLEPRHFARMKGRVTTVSVSAESGVQRVVTEVVKKQLDLKSIERAAEHAHAAGVPLMVHYMIGLPGESAVEVNGTLAFAMDLYERFAAWPAVQFATPLPGTALARGRSLPVVADWGPHFQTAPSQPDAQVPPEELQRFKWTFDERLRAAGGPKKLIMNVTYVCNNHCTFCAVGTRTQVHGHPTRQREHLDKYRRLGVRMVDFDGGEPTLNPELIPLIRYARAIGYERINVTTNGRLSFYEKFARDLVRSGLTTLLFSVHGPDAQTHAQQVGVAEAFEQTVGGIRNCLASAPSGVELGMNITLTKGNYEKLDGVTALAWELGLRWLNIQFLTPFGRATRMVAPDTAAAAEITRRVLDAWGDRMKFQIINLPFCFLPGYERFMMGDLQKLERHMIFVNNEDVNLAAYLAERRTRKPVCEPCPHAVFCGGFYELDEVPEPPWLISASDLVRPVI